MRSLTASEARVLQVLLAGVPGGEEDAIRLSGIPRTTYQTIRRRAFLADWLHERYLPSPAAVRSVSITFGLLQPFAEQRLELIQRLRDDPSVVVLWASPETVFSVRFDPAPENNGHREAGPAGELRRAWRITASGDPESLPVYFDYEGAWAGRTGDGAPITYPRGLPAGAGSAPPPVATVRSLLVHPLEALAETGPALRLSSSFLSRRQRLLLRQGWLVRRILPVLAEIPPYRGSRDERVVFVSGQLQDGWTLPRLRSRLFQEAGVAPFLAAGGEGRALFAMLSPAPERIARRTRSVLGLLEDGIRQIEVVREPIDTFFPVIDHRYDRLLTVEPES